MILYIDTTKGDQVLIELRERKKIIARKSFLAPRMQSEQLLPAIEEIIKSDGHSLKRLKKIKVGNKGGLPKSGEASSFSALRIGVVTANALAYALGVPVEGSSNKTKKAGKIQIVVPQYEREPLITVKKIKNHHHM